MTDKSIEEVCKEINFVPTIGDRGQHHPHNLVGIIWRIKDPESVRIGNSFLAGRLKKGDLFLCVRHSGDFFQDYIFIEEYANCLVSKPKWKFGSYGIGDAERVDITVEEFEELKTGGRIEKEIKNAQRT